jgi:hypothetical protein
MWNLWRKAKEFHSLPSKVFGERDPLAAYMLDNAVLAFGTIIENALMEQHEIGSGQGKKWVKRYTITQLLDPEFKLPRPKDDEDTDFSMPVEGIIFDEVK